MPIARLKNAWHVCLALTVAVSLSGCGTVRFKCPGLITYPPEFQAAAAREVAALPEGSPTGQLVADYGWHRDQCRAIGAQPAKAQGS